MASRFWRAPPAEARERHVPRKKGDPGCHLWVIRESGVPFILERADVVSRLKSGVVKHTNLTGGRDASCGGELWVDPVDAGSLYVNGCSGRYGPETATQMSDAALAIRSLGFRVESFGWDDDANRPAAVRRP